MGKTARRQVGQGGLRKRKDGMWIGTISLGVDGKGKRIRRYVSAKSQAECQRKVAELQRRKDAGAAITTTAPRLSKYLDQWLETTVAPTLKPQTVMNYRRAVALYIKPNLGNVPLDRLSAQHVRQMLTDLGKRRDDGSRLSQATIHRAHRVLRSALSTAEADGLVVKNVARLVKGPTLPPSSRGALSLDEGKALLRSLPDTMEGWRIAAGVLLGARQGEILGLEWSRLDLTAGTATFSWALQRVPWRHGCPSPERCRVRRAGNCPDRELDVAPGLECEQIDGALCLLRPKTRQSWRVVPLPPLVATIFAEMPRVGRFVFHRGDGRPIDPSDDNAAWHDALAAAGLPSIPLHSARHTTASLLRELNTPPDVIQQILGHSSWLTSQGYIHRDLRPATEAMRLLGEAFS